MIFAPFIRRYYAVSLSIFVGGLVLGVLMATGPLRITYGSYYGALHFATDTYAQFFDSPQFQPGATYRVLEPNDREDGMYRFIRHGAVLSNEFFSESIFRRSWEMPQYACFVAFKGIDYVVIEKAYMLYQPSNEQALLGSLVADGRAGVSYVDPEGRFTVYDVRRFAAEQPKPAALSECGIY